MLTMERVLKAANKVIKNGKLGAQRGHSACKYKYPDGCRCVVGAALTDEELASLKKNYAMQDTIVKISDKSYIEVNKDEVQDMRKLQAAHDKWACANEFPENKKDIRKHFYAVLNEMRKKYGVGLKRD